jgi:hypothetical protein
MKMKNITKCLAASVVFGLLSLATQRADAITTGPLEMSYTTDSPYLLGTVIPPDNSGGQLARDMAMTNNLLAQIPLQSQQTLNGALYSRTTLAGGLPATAAGAVLGTGIVDGTTAVSIDLTAIGSTFGYLVVAYDGPNGGVAVFNISGVTGTILLYRYASIQLDGQGHPTGNLLGSNTAQQGYHRMTSWTLLNPTSVPDGGTTVMLLGMALGALGMARRYLRS